MLRCSVQGNRLAWCRGGAVCGAAIVQCTSIINVSGDATLNDSTVVLRGE